jgi:hypothetical protein
MAILVADVIKNPALLDSLSKTSELCPKCGIPLQETITGKRPTPDGDACSDCYYEEVGAIIEMSPLVSAGIRR